MNIVIVSPGMEHTGHTLKEKSLGGSETAAIQMAEALVRQKDEFGKDNRVVVFSPTKIMTACAGVQYLPIDLAQQFISGADIDVLIVSRAYQFFQGRSNAKVNFLWCHDLGALQEGNLIRTASIQADKYLVLTNFHKEQWKSLFGLPDNAFHVIRNGVDLSLFPSVRPPMSAREKGMMVTSCRPERGLDNLVREDGIMERLHKAGVPVTLYVTFYDNPAPAYAEQYKYIFGRCEALPNVKVLGPQTKAQLYELYAKAWVYSYASNWEETSCISAMEVAASGLPIVVTNIGGVRETVKDGTGIKIDAPEHKAWTPGPFRTLDDAYRDKYVAAITEMYNNDLMWEKMSRAAWAYGRTLSWDPVAEDIIAQAQSILGDKTANKAALYKHFWRLADVDACEALVKENQNNATFMEQTEKERGYIKEHYSGWYLNDGWNADAYKAHYEKVAGELAPGAYEGSENEPRWQTMKGWLEANGARFKRILDFGCAYGHQTIRVANLLPEATVFGLDVSENQIRYAEEHRKKHSVHGNVEFGRVVPAGDFDLIILNEVLEHVTDPHALIETCESMLRPGGMIFGTVPYGPWELEDYHNFPHRCHVRHYDWADLIDTLGAKADLQVWYRQLGISKASLDPLGHHYFTYIHEPGRPTGDINMARKLKWQAPRETVSVCMIAYNAEAMLHRCLKSVSPFADEIIVAVDPKTSDSTRAIAAQYGAKVIDGIDPIVNGFDAARNLSIKDATGDWILWIDSDEEVLPHLQLPKYLRNNCLGGYAVEQHHLSVDPPIALKPDLPVRLFRNRRGVRFFGLVHEHPEITLNNGLGFCMILPDVRIAHDGYLTEAIRRDRFLRNIDLVMKDGEKYPTRTLGYFLRLRDYIHICRYKMEQNRNGRGPTPEVLNYAKMAQLLYEERFLDNPHDPMAVEAVAYYSEANALLGVGVPFAVRMKIGPEGPEKEIRAQFPDAEKASRFLSAVTKVQLVPFETKYL